MRIAWECPKGHWTLPNSGFSRPADHRPRHCERCYREWIRATFPIGREPIDIDERLGLAPNEMDVALTGPPGVGHYLVESGVVGDVQGLDPGEEMITGGSLFSGIGGIEKGLESLGIGPFLWQCDSDPCARAVLAAHYPGVRCYEDVREIDGTATRVGLVCGGPPCQGHSVAGKRRGTADPRWMWPEFARVVEALRPPLVFFENVPGLRSSGLRDVLADLAALGFDAEWGVYSASEVGAPHIRKRLFVLAYAHREGQLQQGRALAQERRRSGDGGGEGGAVAGSDGLGLLRRAYDEATAREAGRDAAQGDHPGASVAGLGDLAAGLPQWMAGEPEPPRTSKGAHQRAARLRLLGNSCVPAQASRAFLSLAARALS